MATVAKRRGKWVVDFRDQHGKRRWETYDTRRQADDALAKRIGEVKGGSYRSAADLPTFATVAADWLAGERARNLAASTLEVYARQIEDHMLPAFGPLRIDHVTTKSVEDFRNAKREAKLEAITVNSLLQRLTSVLKYAVKHRYIPTNPAVFTLVDRVKATRVADELPDAIDESEALTAEQAGAFIAASREGIHRTFVAAAILTGLRSGELLGLTWGHVDLEQRTLRVGRSLSWDGSTKPSKPVFGPPKTKSSYRTLDLVPELVAILGAWKLRSRFAADSDLVFANGPGEQGAMRLSYFYKYAQPAFEAAKVPRINLHGLRHSFASLLIMQGRPVTQVAKLLGHKDPTITLAVYSHWFEDAKEKNREALCTLADAVFSAGGSETVAAAAG
jgi:integrase